jgi:putative Mg2+ transporter-C (MgtC) family protein
VIFKEGLNVRGLNTAATLWRSAAVGLLAGMGFVLYGLLCAGIVVASNLILRPLVQAINRQPVDTSEVERTCVASVVCRGADAPQVRALLTDGLTSTPDIAFTEVEIVNIEDADRVEVTATVTSHKRRDIALKYIIGRLSQASGVSRARWRTQTLSV